MHDITPRGRRTTTDNRCSIGIAAIALGIGFNIPYAVLACLYDYPQILRRPASEALHRFAEGGPSIVLAWYGFMFAALALIPVALWLAVTRERIVQSPTLAIGAAIAGSLAGLAQAIGLARWVFTIPALAAHADSLDTQRAFDLLNAYGGVAIGENIGQLLTAWFVAQLAMLQAREGAHWLPRLGGLTALSIALGTGEGVAIALGRNGSLFSIATITGFVALSLWLIATGTMLVRHGRAERRPA
ncbi:MAG: DUF4386 family protein [Sphingomonas sp.]|nr:DUF4386 family protein [Sphingomonas sp.]